MRRRPLMLAITFGAGAVISLVAAFLLLREGRGSLLVITDQPDAVILLNGSKMPTTPGVLIKGLRADTYDVTVVKPGFRPQPESQIINLKAGDTIKLSFTFAALPAPPPPETPRALNREPGHRSTPSASPSQTPLFSTTSKEAPARSPETKPNEINSIDQDKSPPLFGQNWAARFPEYPHPTESRRYLCG